MIDSNNKLKTLSRDLVESAKKILAEKKSDKDLAKLAPPKDKVTHADVLVGRGVYTHDQVKAHKSKKGIKEDADMVVVNAPVLADIDGELAEVLKRDPRDKTVHIQLEGMKYILKKGQYEELPEAVKNPYAVGMAAAMKSTGDEPPLKKSTIVKGHEIAKGIMKNEEVEELDEGLETQTIKHPVGQRPKGIGWILKQAGEQTGKDHSVWQRKFKKSVAEEVELTQEEIENIEAILADLDEARGRPPKEGSAAWKAKQQQDLADMPALSVQVRKAASMNKPVTFMDGKSKTITQGHIDKFHDHMDARKTSQEKAEFQKRAHKSHDEFTKAVSEPIPSSSKDTGEIVKYR